MRNNMPKMPTWQSKTKSQDGKKREVMWSHQMPMWHNGCTHRHGKKQIAKTEKSQVGKKGGIWGHQMSRTAQH